MIDPTRFREEKNGMPGGKLPNPSNEDPEIHPGDFVVLTEGDPYYVGDHPAIVAAHMHGVQGRVLGKVWLALDPKLSSELGCAASYEVRVLFPHHDVPFHFWDLFLKKIPREV